MTKTITPGRAVELLLVLAAEAPDVHRWIECQDSAWLHGQPGMTRILEEVANLFSDWQISKYLPLEPRDRSLRETAGRIAACLIDMGATVTSGDRQSIAAMTLPVFMRRLGREARNEAEPSELSAAIYQRCTMACPAKAYERRSAFLKQLRRGRCLEPEQIAATLGIGLPEARRRGIFSDTELARVLGLSLSGLRSLSSPTPLVAALNKLRERTGYRDPTLARAMASFEGDFRGAPSADMPGRRFSDIDLSSAEQQFIELADKFRSKSGAGR